MANLGSKMMGRHRERGIALLLCIFALLLLTGIALSLMFMSDTETAINANFKDSQRAYQSAMAGLQEARVRLMPDPATGAASPIAPTIMPTTALPGGVTYIVNTNGADDVRPWVALSPLFDTQLCHEGFTGLGVGNCAAPPAGTFYTKPDSIDPYRGTARAMDYKWVRITWKGNLSAAPYYVSSTNGIPTAGLDNTPICFDGTKQIPLPGGLSCEAYMPLGLTTVYRLTSMASTPRGSNRMLQMEVANNPPLITNAAVDSKDHVTLNGKLDVNGFDYCSCNTDACTTTTVGGVATTTCPSRAGKTCDNTKWAIYSASDVDDPNKSETLVAGPNPPIVENGQWKYDIPALINTYKNEPNAKDVTQAPYNWTCTPGTGGANAACGTHSSNTFGVPPKFPPSPVDQPLADPSYGSCTSGVGPGCPNPQVTYVPGNATITAGSIGNGILIVDGDLDIHGGLQFYGLVLVRGVVKFTGGGSDATNIFGAILAGEESYVDNVLGGSAVIRYNACALRQKRAPAPPTMLNVHELAF